MEIKNIIIIALLAVILILLAKDLFSDKKSGKKLLKIILPILILIGGVFLYPSSDENYQQALVTKVADGDTVTVKILAKEYKVRMIGVNTRELSHYGKPEEFYAKEAADFTEDQLLNKIVYLQKDTSDTDQYGRLLRYVWLKKPESAFPSKAEIQKNMYNAILVEEAYAEAKAYPPDTRYENIFASLEETPRLRGEGMWQKFAGKESSKQKKNSEQKGNKDSKTNKQGKIKGNKNSKVYHMPDQKNYNSMSDDNVVYFDSEEEAIQNGYRKAKQ
ncbi:MAG: thermonuclease family protein [Finegoldia sp.]|nr:thermonuclease family protein [Finegoldia sp.]